MICDVCDKSFDELDSYICPNCHWDNAYQSHHRSFHHSLVSYAENLPLGFMDEESALTAIREVFPVGEKTAQTIIDLGYYGEEDRY